MAPVTHCYDNIEALKPNHLAAFAEAERHSYDLSFQWFRNLISNGLPERTRPLIVVAEDQNGKVAILPLCHDDQRPAGPTRIKSLSNFYTSLYAPIVTPNAPGELMEQALSSLVHSRDPWDVIDFSPLSIDEPNFNAIIDALRSLGVFAFKYYCFGNWYLPVDGRSYAEYFQGLPSKLKNTIKRKRNQLLAAGHARLTIITGGCDIERGIADFTRVYLSSWKVPEPFPEFIPGLIRLCADRGWLRLGLVYLNDEPLAAQLWIVAHGRAAIYKLAYDQAFASLSPGSILTAHLMEHALDVDKVREVDYLIGDDPYKKDWMSCRRERWGIIAYNPRTLAGLSGALKQALGDLLRVFRR